MKSGSTIMRVLLILLFLSGISINLFGNIEISAGTSIQLNISTYNFTYSYCLDGTLLYGMGYPVFLGIKYDYQDNFQRLALISVIRFLPEEWHLKIDMAAGGGLASINSSPLQYTFFTIGVIPKVFLGSDMMEGSFIYASVFFMDITTEVSAYSFLNGSAGVGYEF
jgi:hypothetical protein